MCFLVGSVENRFFMLKPVIRLAGLGFYGRRPAADRHRCRVGRFSGKVGRVERVGWVPGLLGHPYMQVVHLGPHELLYKYIMHQVPVIPPRAKEAYYSRIMKVLLVSFHEHEYCSKRILQKELLW